MPPCSVSCRPPHAQVRTIEVSHRWLSQGLVVTDNKGSVVYANRAYADMTGADRGGRSPQVETLFSAFRRQPRSIYRCHRACATASPAPGSSVYPASSSRAASGPRWYRYRPAHSRTRRASTAACRGSSPTFRASAPQERLFLDLQQAIDYLDHAPAGFFAAEPDCRSPTSIRRSPNGSDRSYSFTPGDIEIADARARRRHGSRAVHQGGSGHHQERGDRSRSCKATGQPLPVRSFIVSPPTATARRAPPARRAEPHAGRGFRPTSGGRDPFHALLQLDPDGDCRLVADGRIARTNAPFHSLFSPVVARDAVDR